MDDRKIPRRERERLRQRQEILTAALGLFAQKGYHRVSMHEIAAKAEFAVGTLYKFFKNKEDLYRTLLLEQADDFHEALSQAIEEPGEEIDEIEKLRRFVEVKSGHFRIHAPSIRLFLAEIRGASNLKDLSGFHNKMRLRHWHALNKLAAIFEKGIQNGSFEPIAPPYHLAVALDSLTSTLLLLWLEAPEDHPYPENPDAILNILFKGLLSP